MCDNIFIRFINLCLFNQFYTYFHHSGFWGFGVKTENDQETMIILRGWEAIETLRGQRFDFIILDEVSSMRNFWLHWEEVIRPTLTDTKGECLFISTPKGFDHFYDLYNKEASDTDFKSFHFTTYDNPFIPKEEIDKASKELTEDRFAQEYLADFRKTQGLVYKEFDRDIHVYSDIQVKQTTKCFKPIDNLRRFDWGYTNPCALGKIEKSSDNVSLCQKSGIKLKRLQQRLLKLLNHLEEINIILIQQNLIETKK